MASLRSLIQKRGGNRTATTKLITQAIKNNIDYATNPRDRKIHLLTKKLEDLHTKLKALETLDTAILENLAEAYIAADINDAHTVNFNNN
jgi:hypothetical protein